MTQKTLWLTYRGVVSYSFSQLEDVERSRGGGSTQIWKKLSLKNRATDRSLVRWILEVIIAQPTSLTSPVWNKQIVLCVLCHISLTFKYVQPDLQSLLNVITAYSVTLIYSWWHYHWHSTGYDFRGSTIQLSSMPWTKIKGYSQLYSTWFIVIVVTKCYYG